MLALVVFLAASTPPPDLQLVGVVLASTPERSVAIVRAGERSRSAAPGESAFGGRVVAVTRTGATLEFDGRRVERLENGVAGDDLLAAVLGRGGERAGLDEGLALVLEAGADGEMLQFHGLRCDRDDCGV